VLVTAADDAAELPGHAAAVGHGRPELAASYEELTAAVTEAARRLPRAAVCAGHGAFRAGQLVARDDDAVAVLDLDGFCAADPARDAGNFCAYLAWKAIRDPASASATARARAAFLAGHAATGPDLDPDSLAVHQATSMARIAGRRFTNLAVDEWPAVPTLLGEAAALVG
jgi:aminoglycoside phosphotransferase (APT) family kinase protein